MAFRKLKKFTSVAAIAVLFVASAELSASDQQTQVPADGGCPGCAAAANPFPVSGGEIDATFGSSSLPLSQSLSFTSGLEGVVYGDTVISNQAYETYDNMVPATYATLPSSGTIVSGSTLSDPIGTLTLSTAPAVSSVSLAPAAATQPVYYSSPARSTSSTSGGSASSGLAQSKAQTAANGRIRGHIGGSLGGAKYEGVGWSSVSAQSAIQHCCYWGTRPVAEIGVCRGQDGLWYACVLYN